MKILTKTPTSLHLRAMLTKYVLLDLLVGSFYLSFSIFIFLTPDRKELKCQKAMTNIDCQVTTWNMLGLNSQVKPIQLQDARAEKHFYSKGSRLILKTTQGEIFFLQGSDSDAITIQKQIHDFLYNSNQPKLNVVIGTFGLQCIFVIVLLVLGSLKILSVLRSPVWIEWKFELEPDIADRAERFGSVHGRFRGAFWQRNICHSFSDVIKFNTDILRKGRQHPEYRLYLKLRSVGELELSPQGLSEAQWREVTREISNILHIAPPELPVSNWWQPLTS